MSKKWEILDHKVVFQGYFKMEEYRLRYERFDGGSNEVVREIFERGNAVAVLPYDPRRDEVVLIEQFRPGALNFEAGPWLLEVVAGVVGADEQPEEVARRETLEEAGCELGRVRHLHRYLVSPGGTTERVDIYVGEVDAGIAGGVHGLDEEHEDIKVHTFTREQALKLLDGGRIVNAVTLIGLQWLAVNGGALRHRWLESGDGSLADGE